MKQFLNKIKTKFAALLHVSLSDWLGNTLYKSGDVVVHLQTQTKMTVESSTKTSVDCVWFVGARLYRNTFNNVEVKSAT